MAMLMYPFTPLELLHIQSYHQLCFYQSASSFLSDLISSFLSDQISPDHHDHCSSTLNLFIVIILIIIVMMITVMMITIRIAMMMITGHVYDIDYDG
jgi:hypothetical protein